MAFTWLSHWFLSIWLYCSVALDCERLRKMLFGSKGRLLQSKSQSNDDAKRRRRRSVDHRRRASPTRCKCERHCGSFLDSSGRFGWLVGSLCVHASNSNGRSSDFAGGILHDSHYSATTYLTVARERYMPLAAGNRGPKSTRLTVP